MRSDTKKYNFTLVYWVLDNGRIGFGFSRKGSISCYNKHFLAVANVLFRLEKV